MLFSRPDFCAFAYNIAIYIQGGRGSVARNGDPAAYPSVHPKSRWYLMMTSRIHFRQRNEDQTTKLNITCRMRAVRVR